MPNDDNARGLPVGILTPLHSHHDLDQALLSVYPSYRQVMTSSSTHEYHPTHTVCTLIPSYLSVPDFLNFVGPVDSFVSHYRVLCDGTPDTYLVLMTFRNDHAMHDYYKQYHQRKFSSMEDHVCQVVQIKTIRQTAVQDNDSTQNNCPVCLDTLDATMTGLLTTLCQHTFHVHCLSQWGDGSCPVCRYSQKPTGQPIVIHDNVCQDCGGTTHLWICLVCGQIGCGQADQAHALAHYTATHHVYALDLESQRVWDYAGDNYVHRLIQNVVDGKLVELPQRQDVEQGKLNAMALEYSYLLTSQLDSQRMYYEDRINATLASLSQLSDACKQATRDLMEAESDDVACLAAQADDVRRSNTFMVQKLAQWKDKTKVMERQYLEEKELTRSLSDNNALVQAEIDQLQRHLDTMAAKSEEWMACLEE